ncbi:RUS1 family protein C16orf58 homolog [Erpetoichthys calabaricus]|uniref:RUS family member 1 n=1 Tax=Erpetoichthys calabaricus TaxID=27687 RepID=A0A8C4SES8_ERPCA|nr:RUS1 family protein C16orf58 homolog [Erpetoichthys calabaricus]XP_051790671.1 RUS1 family protein C16orf58 homolog [Erpetoichthys calabaricus]
MAGDSTMHLATERYGSWESWQYMEKAGLVQRKRNDEKRRSWSFIDAFTSVFLPQGYPESVSEDYLSYQLWDTVQAFASSITGTLATQATLRGVGVGNKEATITGATITWILRDGTGMLGRILFAWKKGTKLDCDAKKWRLFADVLNDIAIFMEIVAPAFPACFTLIVCTAGIFKSLVGVAGGATRAALTVHQARRDNMADVSAKDGSQETLVNLAGLLISLLIIPLVADNIILTFVLYFFFTGLHLFSNYKAVCSVVMETLNQARLSILTYHYLKEGSVLTPVEANQREPVLPSFRRRLEIQLGTKLGNVVSSLSDFEKALQDNGKKYIIGVDKRKGRVLVCLSSGAGSLDELQAGFHAYVLSFFLELQASGPGPYKAAIQRCRDIAVSAATNDQHWRLVTETHRLVDVAFPHFQAALQKAGWRTDHTLLDFDEWRVDWAEGNLQKKAL